MTAVLSNPLVGVPIAILLLVAILRKELLDATDRLLIRLRGDYQWVTQDLLETLFEKHSAEAIAEAAAERIHQALHPERLVLYGAEGDLPALPRVYASLNASAPFVLNRDGGLVKHLSANGTSFLDSALLSHLPESERSWLATSGVRLAVPVAGELASELAGAILLGEKLSGDAYWAPDLDLLEDVARQVYLALRMREVEKARDRAIREREEAERSGTKRAQFLAQVSHELRNPLHGVVGLTDLLLETPLTDDQKTYAELIRRSGEWTVALANDILNISRLDTDHLPLETVEFDWLPLLEDVAAIAAERARGKHLEVVLQIEADFPPIGKGDPARVRQVLLNLVENATKFTATGWVLLCAQRAPAPEAALSALIAVQDTGPGVPEEFRSRLFIPFERSATGNSTPEGTGLGLAISRRLAKGMHGELSYEPAPSGGSTFLFRLPAATGARSLPTGSRPLDGMRILVVDPLPVSMWATSLTLTALGATPVASLAELRQDMGTSFDAVLLSAAEPKETVLTIRQARRLQPNIPIIILYRGNERLSEETVGVWVQWSNCAVPRPGIVAASDRTRFRHSPARFGTGEDTKDSCSGVRILVVEDDPPTLFIHRMILGHLGGTIRTASTASEALRSLAQQQPDILLVDGRLPGMDGVELTSAIRRLDGVARGVPIIALCGDASRDQQRLFFEAGANDYLVKPATATEIREVIQVHLKRSVGNSTS